MKVGLFGGSFNPPHFGHKYLISHVSRYCNLTKVFVLVAPQNPFKSKQKLTSSERIKMCHDIFGVNKIRIKILDIEKKINPSCETVKTLIRMKQLYHNQNMKFFWIMGSDNLEHMHLWKYSEKIPSYVEILLFRRNNWYRHLKSKFFIKYHNKIHVIYSKILPISSTLIRNNIT